MQAAQSEKEKKEMEERLDEQKMLVHQVPPLPYVPLPRTTRDESLLFLVQTLPVSYHTPCEL